MAALPVEGTKDRNHVQEEEFDQDLRAAKCHFNGDFPNAVLPTYLENS